jgi:hypothetical protein
MATILSAQELANGPGFDVGEMLRKAGRELDRMRLSRGMETYDHMFNFAVTLAAVCDWTFHLQLSHLPRWSGKNEQNFTYWVRYNSDDAFVFVDISNEYKHADRKIPSTLAQKVMLNYYDLGAHPQLRTKIDVKKGWVHKAGAVDWFMFPAIKFNGNTEHFYDPAQRAIAWWQAFTPAMAQPMDKAGNILP